MILTLDLLFRNPDILKAVIDRTIAVEQDVPFWQKFMTFQNTTSRVFRTYFGTQTGVRMGSVIAKNAAKPIRERQSLGKGYGEVATMGDSYQIDNERLDQLRALTDKYNERGESEVVEEIVNFLVDDFREVRLAPYQRMDKVLGDMLSTGKAYVDVDTNPDGVSALDIELPFITESATADQKGKMLPFMQNLLAEHRKSGVYTTMLMSRETYIQKFALTTEFTTQFKNTFGNSQIITKGGVMTPEMANAIFNAFGLPSVSIVDKYVESNEGEMMPIFADDKICFLQSASNLGKMRWHTPYEATDPVPGKTYQNLDGGQFISTKRTEEGRFVEYGCEWIPEIKNPDKIILLDVSGVK